ncbi:hypothetical protein EV191_11195 [Tamaricihabitans halophyticus]|uniref:Secreted protein n=1 Tax=Tamaricihabitans halophyticus TaxID=1262583 RepID=A0A4R2QFI0_9PSEU|nr:hypothetical protein [Tamaricihabitans halophyticus]TCP47890.1 hypothetical protein EV191_11195 [Tamaricihabitans halophyticus]
MRKTSRVLVVMASTAALFGIGAGAASAEAVESSTPVWALPGVDIGPLAAPLATVPTEVLAPVYGVITAATG